MELGNMVFGNSRGEYSVSRRAGFEEILVRLFDLIEPDNGGYGADYENDTFSAERYWWGDCTCGAEAPAHTDDCPDCYKNKRWLSDEAECSCGGTKFFNSICVDESYWDEDHDHKDTCRLVRPNFIYKPNGFAISWYKYPLRDSYSNEKFDADMLNAIIDDCIASLSDNQVAEE